VENQLLFQRFRRGLPVGQIRRLCGKGCKAKAISRPPSEFIANSSQLASPLGSAWWPTPGSAGVLAPVVEQVEQRLFEEAQVAAPERTIGGQAHHRLLRKRLCGAGSNNVEPGA
jgi:hypothetical protein